MTKDVLEKDQALQKELAPQKKTHDPNRAQRRANKIYRGSAKKYPLTILSPNDLRRQNKLLYEIEQTLLASKSSSSAASSGSCATASGAENGVTNGHVDKIKKDSRVEQQTTFDLTQTHGVVAFLEEVGQRGLFGSGRNAFSSPSRSKSSEISLSTSSSNRSTCRAERDLLKKYRKPLRLRAHDCALSGFTGYATKREPVPDSSDDETSADENELVTVQHLHAAVAFKSPNNVVAGGRENFPEDDEAVEEPLPTHRYRYRLKKGSVQELDDQHVSQVLRDARGRRIRNEHDGLEGAMRYVDALVGAGGSGSSTQSSQGAETENEKKDVVDAKPNKSKSRINRGDGTESSREVSYNEALSGSVTRQALPDEFNFFNDMGKRPRAEAADGANHGENGESSSKKGKKETESAMSTMNAADVEQSGGAAGEPEERDKLQTPEFGGKEVRLHNDSQMPSSASAKSRRRDQGTPDFGAKRARALGTASAAKTGIQKERGNDKQHDVDASNDEQTGSLELKNEHHCKTWQQDGSCFCYKAKRSQRCSQCKKAYIEVGDCIEKHVNGWQHVNCPLCGGGGEEAITAALLPVARSLEEAKEHACLVDSEREALRAICDVTRSGVGGGSATQLTVTPSSSSNTTPGPAGKAADLLRLQLQTRAFANDTDTWTIEQNNFLNSDIPLGSVVRVRARAGCGKTTMAAEYTRRFLQREPYGEVLYVVFGKKNEEEARNGGKFDLKRVEIRTSHAFAKKYAYSAVAETCDKFDRQKVCDFLNLFSLVLQAVEENRGKAFSKAPEKRLLLLAREQKARESLGRITRTVAGLISETVTNFCQSSGKKVRKGDVSHRAFRGEEKGTEWKDMFDESWYVEQAQKLFLQMMKEIAGAKAGDLKTHLVGVPHDGYLKAFSLECPQLSSPPYGYSLVIVDECQDMTPAQAAFWRGQENGRTLLFGDVEQRIYRWRGARRDFERGNATEFPLTVSFRFGAAIADLATRLLRVVDPGASVVGRGKRGQVSIDVAESSNFLQAHDNKVVVLCRTNKQIVTELLNFRKERGGFPRWCYAKGDQKPPDADKAAKFQKFFQQAGGSSGEGRDDTETQPLAIEGAGAVAGSGGGASSSSSSSRYTQSSAGASDPTSTSASSFHLDGEEFETWKDLMEFLKEEGDGKNKFLASLVEELAEKGEDAAVVLREMQRSFVRDSEKHGSWEVKLATMHGVKGMEYKETVLLSDDVKIEDLPEPGTPAEKVNENQRDMINLLYVAVTRAMGNLRVRPDLWAYFQSLGQELFYLENSLLPVISDMANPACLPQNLDDLGVAEASKRFRLLKKRYHYDKWSADLRSEALEEAERIALIARLNNIVQAAVKGQKSIDIARDNPMFPVHATERKKAAAQKPTQRATTQNQGGRSPQHASKRQRYG
eukprot:g1086.t1